MSAEVIPFQGACSFQGFLQRALDHFYLVTGCEFSNPQTSEVFLELTRASMAFDESALCFTFECESLSDVQRFAVRFGQFMESFESNEDMIGCCGGAFKAYIDSVSAAARDFVSMKNSIPSWDEAFTSRVQENYAGYCAVLGRNPDIPVLEQ